MKLKKLYHLSLLGIIAGFLTIGCGGTSKMAPANAETVKLQWKISPEDTLKYKTIMNDIGEQKLEMNFGGMFDKLFDSIPEKDKLFGKDFFNKLQKSFNDTDFITLLTDSKYFDNTVDIAMYTVADNPFLSNNNDKDDNEAEKKEDEDMFVKLLKKMMRGIMLRGNVYKTGGLQSFWLKSGQKNLVSLFFELPDKELKVGDKWTLDNVNLISFDQNFICEKADKKNVVILSDIITENNEKIAVIDYDIYEYAEGIFENPFLDNKVDTKMKMVYKAQAKFSITQGKWVSYTGIMSLDATGFLDSKQKKKFALIEIE